jgi:hypothetical protein
MEKEHNRKSHQGQDVHVLHTIFKGKKNGYFMEVGAYDGVEGSNTYLMEKSYGWKGILVECSPRWYPSIWQNRNAILMPYAVFNEDDKILNFYDTGNGIAGLVDTNEHYSNRTAPIINVMTKKLTTILDNACAPNYIDFLSLDTEGSEYEILSHHDFDKYLFGYICVEHNNVVHNRTRIRELLISKGYLHYRENHVDDDYIHRSLVQEPEPSHKLE